MNNPDKDNEECENDEILLRNLQSEYENGFDLKSSLDTKASSIITASIISSSLLVSITTLSITLIKSVNIILPSIIGLIIGIILSLFTIILSMHAYRIRKYGYSIVSSSFFDQTGKFIESRLVAMRTAKKKEYYFSRLKDYLHTINENEKTNNIKSRIIVVSQWTFFGSIGFLLGSIIILLILLATGYASLKP